MNLTLTQTNVEGMEQIVEATEPEPRNRAERRKREKQERKNKNKRKYLQF